MELGKNYDGQYYLEINVGYSADEVKLALSYGVADLQYVGQSLAGHSVVRRTLAVDETVCDAVKNTYAEAGKMEKKIKEIHAATIATLKSVDAQMIYNKLGADEYLKFKQRINSISEKVER